MHEQENAHETKLSRLTAASVAPSNQEKQKVSLALKVFSDKTVSALKTSTGSTDSWKITAQFIGEIVRMWKLLNTKSVTEHKRRRDDARIPIDISSRGDKALDCLNLLANLASLMRKRGKHRVRKLTMETSDALKVTLRGLAALSKYLLETTTAVRHEFVLLGFFQQDDLEHHFGHFRRSAGCNYYISVREVMSTHHIDRAKFMLAQGDTFDMLEPYDAIHKCDQCEEPISESDLLLLDDLAETEDISATSVDELIERVGLS